MLKPHYPFIQVHPSNELAKMHHNSFGKNDMWYIMEAEENDELILGINQKLTQKRYKRTIDEGQI